MPGSKRTSALITIDRSFSAIVLVSATNIITLLSLAGAQQRLLPRRRLLIRTAAPSNITPGFIRSSRLTAVDLDADLTDQALLP
jgi:hypothetical protein